MLVPGSFARNLTEGTMSQGWQAPGWQSPYGARTVDQAAYDAGLRAYMLRIFSYMAGGLGVTGLVALAVASSDDWISWRKAWR